MPKAELLPRKFTKPEAEKETAALRKQYRGLEAGWFALGRRVALDVERHIPQAMGMNLTDWLEKTFDASAAKVFRALRAAKALKGVPEKTLKAMPEGNAVQLARLPEKERKSKEWVDRAVSITVPEVKQAVDEFMEKKTGQKKTKWKTFRVSLPDDVYDLLLEAEAKIARVIGVDVSDKSEHLIDARIKVWEAIASLISLTDESQLKVETIGDTDATERKS
jgi:Glu-tRNA(Gln) amidotransferase subunit E-like FAD-binding protein